MSDNPQNPQINVSRIRSGGGIAGALFAVISTVIFLIGIPMLRYFLPAAIVIGCAVALMIHFVRHETPGTPWIRSATEKKAARREDAEANNRDHSRDSGIIFAPLSHGKVVVL